MNTFYFKQEVSFETARRIQEHFVQRLAKESQQEEANEVIFYLEHPPLITLGKNIKNDSELITDSSLPIHKTSRGGQEIVHSPGQLMIYPCINLKKRGLGLRQFVEIVLGCIKEALIESGIRSNLTCNCQGSDNSGIGLWYVNNQGKKQKIAFCGLRIIRGVSNHGFCVNLNNDLDLLKKIKICGNPNLDTTSYNDITKKKIDKDKFVNLLNKIILSSLDS